MGKIEIVTQKKNDYWFVHSPYLRVYGKSKVSSELAFLDFIEGAKNFIGIHTERGTLEDTLVNFKKGLN